MAFVENDDHDILQKYFKVCTCQEYGNEKLLPQNNLIAEPKIQNTLRK